MDLAGRESRSDPAGGRGPVEDPDMGPSGGPYARIARDLEGAVRGSPVSICFLDADLRFTWICNPGEDFKLEELIGHRADELIPPQDAAELMAFQREVLRSLVPLRREVAGRSRGREWIYDITGEAFRDEQGRPIGLRLVAVDVTARHRAEENARRREEDLRLIADAMPSLMSFVDAGLVYRFVNRSYEEWFGLPRSQIVNRHMKEVLGEKAFQLLLPHFQAALSGATVTYEKWVDYQGAGRRCIDARYVPRRNLHGQVEGFFVFVRDVSMRRAAEDALAAREAEFRALFELAGTGKAQAEPGTGRFLRVNRRFCEITGYDADELCRMTFLDITHPDDRERERNAYASLLRGPLSNWHTEKRYLRKDGSIAWVGVYGTLVRDAENRPLFTVASILDITARHVAEQALRQMADLPQQNPNPVLRIGWDGSVLLINEPARALLDELGWREGEEVPELIRDPVREALGSSRVANVEVRCRRGRTLLFTVAPIVGESYANLYGQDITDRQRAEAALRESEERLRRTNQELARSNAELEEFASVVSHDLRSPLSAIGGCAQLLAAELGDSLAPDAAETLSYLHDGVQQMARLIASLLDYSRVGRGEVKLAPCDPGVVVQEIVRVLSPSLEAAGAEVTHDPLPQVQADQALLAQLFQNLIENAVKYRRETPPRVHISAQKDGSALIFCVRDNGIGMDPADADRIFAPFRRLHDDESRFPGLGMGLATCKKIVERHGGRIWVNSASGQGATFCFSLPA